MHEHLIPIIDEFLNQYVWDRKCFADDETLEQATEDERGGGDFLPLTYDRSLVDPADASRLLVSPCVREVVASIEAQNRRGR